MSEDKTPALPPTHLLYTEPKDGRLLPPGSLFWVGGLKMDGWSDNQKQSIQANDVVDFEYAVPVTSLGKEETNSPDTLKESWEKNITPPPATHVLYEGPKHWQKLPPGSLFWVEGTGWEELPEVTAIPGYHKYYAIPLNVSIPTTSQPSSPVEPDILEEARALIQGDRAASYGDAKASFERIAAFWTAYKGIEITAKDVAAMMILLKVSRGVTSAKRDNWVDMIGYAALGSQIEGGEA